LVVEEEVWYGRVVTRRLIDEWDVAQAEHIRKLSVAAAQRKVAGSGTR
jgi:hypothetical protein